MEIRGKITCSYANITKCIQPGKTGLFLIPHNSYSLSLGSVWPPAVTQKHFCVIFKLSGLNPFSLFLQALASS
ncbi:Sphingomyelin Phosphodiesterase 4 [Manis pentadactyla]|nr:Sphingomyelin Phosphodiesterase 4 [Manis pentadactyla]